jgi:hypothetical protein
VISARSASIARDIESPDGVELPLPDALVERPSDEADDAPPRSDGALLLLEERGGIAPFCVFHPT